MGSGPIAHLRRVCETATAAHGPLSWLISWRSNVTVRGSSGLAAQRADPVGRQEGPFARQIEPAILRKAGQNRIRKTEDGRLAASRNIVHAKPLCACQNMEIV